MGIQIMQLADTSLEEICQGRGGRLDELGPLPRELGRVADQQSQARV